MTDNLPKFEQGQLVFNPFNNTLYEVSLRVLEAGCIYRGRRIKEPVTVTSFIAYNMERRALRQVLREKGLTGGRQKVKMRKLIKRSSKNVDQAEVASNF